jgi:hypothetical protein
MIACYLCWVEVSLCRCSCVVCYISVLPLDLIFVKACYFLEWDRICVGFLVLYFYISIAFWSHFCDSVLSFGMRSNLCWLPCVTLFFFLYCRWRKYPISKLDIIKPATFRAYPNAWHGFPTPSIVVILLGWMTWDKRWLFCLLILGEIVGHYCLYFLFIRLLHFHW